MQAAKFMLRKEEKMNNIEETENLIYKTVKKLKLDIIRLSAAFLILIAAIMLEAQPNSFLMAFAAPPDSDVEAFYANCSYFDLLPVGYGQWGPILTGILSCGAVILLVVLIILRLCKKTAGKLETAIFIINLVALFFSLAAVFFSSRCMPASTGICLLLMLSTFLQIKNNKSSHKINGLVFK